MISNNYRCDLWKYGKEETSDTEKLNMINYNGVVSFGISVLYDHRILAS